MIGGALLIAAAQAASAPAASAVVLECALITPSTEALAFLAEISETGAVAFLTPSAGTAWPAQRLAGTGSLAREEVGVEAKVRLGGSDGLSLEIEGERATLLGTEGKRKALPLAYGFCLRGAAAAAAEGETAIDADADVAALDPAGWPETCGLITRGRQRARIDYTILDMGARSYVRAATPALLGGKTEAAVSRKQGSRRSRFSGKEMAGYETLIRVDDVAVQLIEFERIGSLGPAAAICGHSKVVRRPNRQ